MLSAAGFAKTWKYIELFKEGLVCTVSLSALTVLFGFFLALFLAVFRLSDINVFRFLSRESQWRLREKGGFVYAAS
ncbi:MAG: amino acid ABC transporter permease, partial [Oscillospiraceae bacterium]|nr:amino acid ABC transporter permease [Oscillospiraceae bacterium]